MCSSSQLGAAAGGSGHDVTLHDTLLSLHLRAVPMVSGARRQLAQAVKTRPHDQQVWQLMRVRSSSPNWP